MIHDFGGESKAESIEWCKKQKKPAHQIGERVQLYKNWIFAF
jgi:hypothetical protein